MLRYGSAANPALSFALQQYPSPHATMKKISLSALAIGALVFALSSPLMATPKEKKPVSKEITVAERARMDVLTSRLTFIKNMDKSDMTRVEKKALRQEVKSMEKELKEIGGGVYLSVAAIIIIILILILVL